MSAKVRRNIMVNGDKQDDIWLLEDELITLNQKLITLHRLQADVKEEIEFEVEIEYKTAKMVGNSDKIAELSNEKLRSHAVKKRLSTTEVELPYDEGEESEFIAYLELVELIDAAELEKLRLLRDIGYEKREFQREFSRAGMQTLTESMQ